MSGARLVCRALNLIPWRLRDKIKSIPGIASLQRQIVSMLLDGLEFVHRVDAGPAKGINFLVKLPEDKNIWAGTYESGFAERLATAVRPGTTAFDIGSWHGFFAGVMAAQGASAVHVFEPLPANVERIRKLIELNPEHRIELHDCAVGASDGHMNLEIMPETSMAKLSNSSFQSHLRGVECLPVVVRSIDSVIAAGEATPPALMKIDVEGAEVMVLEGAQETIIRHRPHLFIEVHSSVLLAQCAGILERLGYQYEHISFDQNEAMLRDVFQIVGVPKAR